jgi:hypothetical protein
MNNRELEKLAKVLGELEWDAYRPYKNLSGGFAKAEMYAFDEDDISVELTFGVQSDCQSTVHTENLEINRKTMEVIN